MTDIFKGTKWEHNKAAQRIIRDWLRRSNRDAGNYYSKQLEDIGFVGDSKNGYDWGNEPNNN